jgi:hypothetical protein
MARESQNATSMPRNSIRSLWGSKNSRNVCRRPIAGANRLRAVFSKLSLTETAAMSLLCLPFFGSMRTVVFFSLRFLQACDSTRTSPSRAISVRLAAIRYIVRYSQNPSREGRLRAGLLGRLFLEGGNHGDDELPGLDPHLWIFGRLRSCFGIFKQQRLLLGDSKVLSRQRLRRRFLIS